VSDIPIGSPPAPPGRHAAPSGWYPDPVDPAQERYWDGWQWSRNTRLRDLGPSSTPPLSAGRGPYAGPAGSYATPALRPGQAPVPLTADGVPLAGWGRRALAATLDAMISYFVASLLITPFYAPLSQAFSDYLNATMSAQTTGGPPPAVPVMSDFISTRDQVLAGLVLFACWMAYNVVFLRWKSATPGKMALGIRVVPVDQGRAPAQLSWAVATKRSALWLLPRMAGLIPTTVGLFIVLRLADVLLPLRHPKRQSLHDLLAHTQVVRSR
jgi:uncharacterized RDD family membrane protein YckC